MSGPTQNVGTTLTGGIQDISALLPLLGTDQCEQHVGSALDGGYLYAAAAPLSIFGCLGIVKAGISILISSISIHKVSISLRPFTMRFSQEQWLGARTLNNAGFKPVGTVAPLIAMDGDRYKAEMRLMEILGEKNIDNPENISIEWESRKWNISLVLFTILAAAVSGTPYIALLLHNSQRSSVHSPWIFPLLRTVGSCLATVCCQFLVQSRIISLMKNRIVFMVMNRILIDDLSKHTSKPNKVEMDRWLKQYLRWDVDLPAEQCLWNLEQFLSPSFTQPMNGTNKPQDHVSIEMSTLSFSNRDDIRGQLKDLRGKHFLTPTFDYVYMLILWIILCLSLPATVVGYIGCFTLVSGSPGNGPVFWLGLEAALSIIRILVWAWNPKWDEDSTGLTVQLKLTKDHPIVTTEKDVEVTKSTGDNTLALVPERRFLEWITPYTGPLEQFRTSESLFLYFTLTGTTNRLKPLCLYMTVFDFNKRLAVTLLREEGVLKYIDATVLCNQISSEMEAIFRSVSGKEHPWATNDATLFDALAEYYESIMHALNRSHLHSRAPDNPQLDLDKHRDSHTPGTATLPQKWSLLPKQKERDNQSPGRLVLQSPTERNQLYLGRGYEHHLKTELIEKWSSWIVSDLNATQTDSRDDCHHALADVASDEAKWELTELDSQLVWEWTRRELVLVLSSTKIEDVLKRRMDECIDKVTKEQGNASGRLRQWMLSEFRIGRRKRLEKERGQAKERMEKEMKDASECAEKEMRQWMDDEDSPSPRWEAALKFIDKQWLAVIDHSALENAAAVSDLDKSFWRRTPRWPDDKARLTLVEQVRQRFKHWTPQRENERNEMDATIEHISQADSEHPYYAYEYPTPNLYTTARFVTLQGWASEQKVCAATVYDVRNCEEDHIRDVINKSTTRSVINVDPALIESIPKNDHLLYIGFSSDSGKEPAFIQRNRDRWWDQQTGNSSTFYFSPEGLGRDSDGASVAFYTRISTIAHIFIFLETPSRLRLRLLRRQDGDASVFIQEKGKKLHHITREIPENNPAHFRLQDFELDQFEPGRHELELVVTSNFYILRDILIEFFDDPPSDSSLDNTGSNLATKVQHGDADAGSSGTGDMDAEEDRDANADALPPAVQNDIPS